MILFRNKQKAQDISDRACAFTPSFGLLLVPCNIVIYFPSLLIRSSNDSRFWALVKNL